jgi:galactose mutarotase-like enzyme
VRLGAAERLLADDRMIPTGAREPLAHTEFTLGEQSWDDGLAGLSDPAEFSVSAGGQKLIARFEEGYRFAQVYAPPGQDFICFEPMTAPTNALAGSDALPVVAPGEQYRARWRVTVAAEH